MKTNALPPYDASDNPTGCCPRFDPDGWDDQPLHFENKRFLMATTKSERHVPVDMGQVFQRIFGAIEKAGASDENDFIVLSRDVSASAAEHYFAVSRPVPGEEIVSMSGDFLTKVYEGPFENVQKWENDIVDAVSRSGQEASNVYYFYTTCPKCADTYGKNYVVAVAELADR